MKKGCEFPLAAGLCMLDILDFPTLCLIAPADGRAAVNKQQTDQTLQHLWLPRFLTAWVEAKNEHHSTPLPQALEKGLNDMFHFRTCSSNHLLLLLHHCLCGSSFHALFILTESYGNAFGFFLDISAGMSLRAFNRDSISLLHASNLLAPTWYKLWIFPTLLASSSTGGTKLMPNSACSSTTPRFCKMWNCSHGRCGWPHHRGLTVFLDTNERGIKNKTIYCKTCAWRNNTSSWINR